jgi:glycosyltransferase involved in cell wall biosynthesis
VTKPNVLGLFAGVRRSGPTACDAYRIIFPFQKMGEYGYTAHWMPITRAFQATQMGRLDPAEYDVFVLARVIAPIGQQRQVEQFITTLRSAGKAVVCEWDDDYTNSHRDVTGEGVATNVLAGCTAGTASTPYLRDTMQRYNDDVSVLPNTIEMEMWEPFAPTEQRADDALTVGLVGTSTHEEDWKPIEPALRRIAKNYPEVVFFVGGFVPEYLKDLPRLTIGAKVPFVQYPGLVRQIDIGLAPLDPNDAFNKSKSGIKALEYMASKRRLRDGSYGGAATVATSTKVYRRVCNNRHNALLVRDHYDSDEWYERIAQLIEDWRLRLKIQRQGHEWVIRNRTIDKHWRKWADAYSALTKRSIQ